MFQKDRFNKIIAIVILFLVVALFIQYKLVYCSSSYRTFLAKIYFRMQYGIETVDGESFKSNDFVRLDDGTLITYECTPLGLVTKDNYATYIYGQQVAEEVQEVAEKYFSDCHAVYSPYADGENFFHMYKPSEMESINEFIENADDNQTCTIMLQIPENGEESNEDNVKACLEDCAKLYDKGPLRIECTLLPENIYDGTKDISIYPLDYFGYYNTDYTSNIYTSLVKQFGTADFIKDKDGSRFVCGFISMGADEANTNRFEYFNLD